MRQRSDAFTLVEVLVAMSILVIVLGIAYGAYAAATQSVDRCKRRMTVEQDARALLGMLERELRCGYLRAGETRSSARPDTPHFRCDPKAADGAVLDFTTSGGLNDPDAPGPGICRVMYALDENAGLLLRKQDDAAWLCVARGVQALTVKAHDGREWRARWDSTAEGGLPGAVQVEIAFEGNGGAPCAFTTAVALAVLPAAESTASGGTPVPVRR